MYADNTSKFTAVLNGRHPLPVQVNALGHLTAGLAAALPEGAADYLDYPCPAGRFEASLSRYPFIVLAAKSSNHLQSLVDGAQEAGMAYNAFTTSMLGASAADQQARTVAATADEIDYVAVVLFGPAAEMAPLTKRFSLFKDTANRKEPA